MFSFWAESSVEREDVDEWLLRSEKKIHKEMSESSFSQSSAVCNLTMSHKEARFESVKTQLDSVETLSFLKCDLCYQQTTSQYSTMSKNRYVWQSLLYLKQ